MSPTKLCRHSYRPGKCPVCKVYPGQTGQQQRVKRTRQEMERRRAAVAAHVQAHGWTCPGWNREPHPSKDLTADHEIAQVEGGVDGPINVLCRSCNSSKGASGW